jgi:hypothetical protein
MNFEETIAQATHLEVDAEPRYWEDAIVNGVEDDDGTLIPGRDGESWKVRIDLAAGRIEDWPEGTEARIHYKVCDAGLYWLTDAQGKRIATRKGHYVPGEYLRHGDNGFGDYIILNVGSDGVIAEYRRPETDPDRWVPMD